MVFRVEFAVFFTRNSKVNFILERRLQSKIYDSYLESEVFRVINQWETTAIVIDDVVISSKWNWNSAKNTLFISKR